MGTLNHCGGAELLREAPKSPNNVTSTFFNTVNLLSKELRFDHGGAKLVFCSGHHVTSLRPCLQGTDFWCNSKESYQRCRNHYEITYLMSELPLALLTVLFVFFFSISNHLFEKESVKVTFIIKPCCLGPLLVKNCHMLRNIKCIVNLKFCCSAHVMLLFQSPLQIFPGIQPSTSLYLRRFARKTKAASDPYHFHKFSVEGIGKSFCRDSLPRHIYQGRLGSEDWLDRGKSPGEIYRRDFLVQVVSRISGWWW